MIFNCVYEWIPLVCRYFWMPEEDFRLLGAWSKTLERQVCLIDELAPLTPFKKWITGWLRMGGAMRISLERVFSGYSYNHLLKRYQHCPIGDSLECLRFYRNLRHIGTLLSSRVIGFWLDFFQSFSKSSQFSVAVLVFYCCGKTPWPVQLTVFNWVYKVLEFVMVEQRVSGTAESSYLKTATKRQHTRPTFQWYSLLQ